jgi:hypothetical protein
VADLPLGARPRLPPTLSAIRGRGRFHHTHTHSLSLFPLLIHPRQVTSEWTPTPVASQSALSPLISKLRGPRLVPPLSGPAPSVITSAILLLLFDFSTGSHVLKPGFKRYHSVDVVIPSFSCDSHGSTRNPFRSSLARRRCPGWHLILIFSFPFLEENISGFELTRTPRSPYNGVHKALETQRCRIARLPSRVQSQTVTALLRVCIVRCT